MRIWTIQNEAAWAYLEEHGCLQASRQHQSDYWPKAYEWIREQLIARVGPPLAPDAAPLWGWYQWNGTARKRPDLRSVRHNYNPPGRYVLIECVLPDEAVMLSDYEAWHIILNDGYVGVTERDCNAHYAALERCSARPDKREAERLWRRQYESWTRVIDMEVLKAPYYHAMKNKPIQACFWRLKRDQIRSAKPFLSAGRLPHSAGA